MTIEEIRQKKSEMGYTNEQLSELSGVPLGTVQKVLAGITKCPRYETLRKLERALDRELERELERALEIRTAGTGALPVSGTPGYNAVLNNCMLRETPASYGTSPKKSPDLHTVAEYMALPDEQRVELIDGVFYDMAAPRSEHQFLIGEIFAEFLAYVKAGKGKCLPFVSPIDVQLDCDEYTMVQPDIVILCDRAKIQNGHIMGAPDLVVEVLSPSTARKDRVLKLTKYALAGVREYWIIDIRKEKVIVYRFAQMDDPEASTDDDEITIYTFRDKVPVGIWEDKCVIDFARIDDFYKDVYGTE